MTTRALTRTAAAAALTGLAVLAGPVLPAHAAQGVLTVSGNRFVDPSGCYEGRFWPLIVDNQTDGVAVVYDGQNCEGNVLRAVRPGASATEEFGASVLVR
ncbi:hypothetical protein ACIBFB_17645 [Nocardiopsis sp. NPDC050513]|uniref:hypothetical protein n=1 Tax=Nocardiopsis sp. NPDC050513 TaxID=3364338 RepID=UPI00378ABDE4